MSIAECYVINVQCDDTLHGDHAVREQFTGDTKRKAHAALRAAGWRVIGTEAARCPACRQKHDDQGAADGVAAADNWQRPDNTCPRCKQPAFNLFRTRLPGDELDTTHCGCLYRADGGPMCPECGPVTKCHGASEVPGAPAPFTLSTPADSPLRAPGDQPKGGA